MLNEIFDISRRLRVNHKQILSHPSVNKDLIALINQYLADYVRHHELMAQDVLDSYDDFINKYSEDIEDFISTGKYPIALDKKSVLRRSDYDIALILSTTTTRHRYKIMDNIEKYCSHLKGNIAIIGLGSGLELELLNRYSLTKDIEAYDINISEFVKDRFHSINLIESEFVEKREFYNHIFAIELLEHLDDPYQLLSICYSSLKSKGELIITTAMNIPQWDHLFNFDDDEQFERKVRDLGFEILDKEDIEHESFNKKLTAKNTWYALGKR